MKFLYRLLLGGLALLFLWLAAGLTARAQAPTWQSVRAVAVATAVSSGHQAAVTATASDGAGNVYVAGSFRGTVALGSFTLTSPNSNGSGFVAKWLAATGTYAWVVPTDADIRGFAVQGSAVYVAGYTGSAAATFGTTTLSSRGFVARLTDAGASASFTWALPVDDLVKGVAVSGANVYVIGSFSTTVHFGNTVLTYADPSGYPDMYVAKLTDTGSTATFAWAYRTGTVGVEDFGNAVAATGSTVYVTGLVSAAAPVFGSSTVAPAGMLVARLTDNGSTAGVGWVSTAASSAPANVVNSRALALGAGRVYVVGEFYGAVSFGSTALLAPASGAGFVARLTDMGAAGSFAWATRADATLRGLAVSGSSVYVAGLFDQATAAFGSTTLTNSDASGASYDAVVAKLSDTGPGGTFAWARSAGSSPGGDGANSLALSGSTVFVGGATENAAASFAPLTLTNTTGGAVGFLATLTDVTLATTRATALASRFTVYPNPVHGTATVQLAAGTAAVQVLDGLGREVRRQAVAAMATEATLDLMGLPAGLYLVRAGEGAAATCRVVVAPD